MDRVFVALRVREMLGVLVRVAVELRVGERVSEGLLVPLRVGEGVGVPLRAVVSLRDDGEPELVAVAVALGRSDSVMGGVAGFEELAVAA